MYTTIAHANKGEEFILQDKDKATQSSRFPSSFLALRDASPSTAGGTFPDGACGGKVTIFAKTHARKAEAKRQE